jgi:hypothetical protein
MKNIVVYLTSLIVITLWSCGNTGVQKNLVETQKKILQQKDGTVSLKLDSATCYNDRTNPSYNTAEWNFVISKPGRFRIWLSSATTDTTNLNYKSSVRINLLDNQLEVNPLCDKIVHNSDDVHYPYFRADSFMGSIYVSEPGEYNIQLISEKVISKKPDTGKTVLSSDTELMSVNLTPND